MSRRVLAHVKGRIRLIHNALGNCNNGELEVLGHVIAISSNITTRWCPHGILPIFTRRARKWQSCKYYMHNITQGKHVLYFLKAKANNKHIHTNTGAQKTFTLSTHEVVYTSHLVKHNNQLSIAQFWRDMVGSTPDSPGRLSSIIPGLLVDHLDMAGWWFGSITLYCQWMLMVD